MAIRFKGGRYYLVKYTGTVDGKTKYKWTGLTKDKASSIALMEQITGMEFKAPGGKSKEDIETFVRKAYRSCVRRSDERGIQIDISQESIFEMLHKQDYKCSVSGIAFDLMQIKKNHGRPFAPSIDRIKPELGYVIGNVRLVCLVTNYAMNQWGEGILDILLTAYMRHKAIGKTEAKVAATLSFETLESQVLREAGPRWES